MFIIILNASEIVDGLHRNSSAASFCDNLPLNAMDLSTSPHIQVSSFSIDIRR
jgi:hypothetical protein